MGRKSLHVKCKQNGQRREWRGKLKRTKKGKTKTGWRGKQWINRRMNSKDRQITKINCK